LVHLVDTLANLDSMAQNTKIASYKIAKPPTLDRDIKWNEWYDTFVDTAEAYGWKDEVLDKSKKDNWPLARNLLMTCTEKHDHARIRACDNLCEALDTLKDAHHVTAQVDALQLLKQLHELKIRPDEDVRSVVNRVEEVCNSLASIGKKVDEDEKIAHVITILQQNMAYKLTLDHMLATATSRITIKDLLRGFNVIHARASVVPGALVANGARDVPDPMEAFIEKFSTKLEEGMANLAKKVEVVERTYRKAFDGNNRGRRGGRGGGRGGYNNGGRGGRGGNDRYHPYGQKEVKFDGNCNNCGKYGHRARECFRPCKICNDTSHNITKCPKNPRAPSNQNRGRGGFNKAPPRAHVAQAPGYLYNSIHDDEDVVPSANMVRGMDSEVPPGFGLRHSEGPSMMNTPYGKALNALKYKTHLHTWILDGGATHHMTPMKDTLFDYVPDVTPMYVKVAINQWAKRAGVGSIRVHTKVNGVPMSRVIKDVWHMPTFDNSLLSANQLKAKGHWIISGRNGDMNEYVFDGRDTLWLTCRVSGGLNVPYMGIRNGFYSFIL
jgi:gag-polypeptide of LTR copia-type